MAQMYALRLTETTLGRAVIHTERDVVRLLLDGWDVDHQKESKAAWRGGAQSVDG
jgi:hypothetical protein